MNFSYKNLCQLTVVHWTVTQQSLKGSVKLGWPGMWKNEKKTLNEDMV